MRDNATREEWEGELYNDISLFTSTHRLRRLHCPATMARDLKNSGLATIYEGMDVDERTLEQGQIRRKRSRSRAFRLLGPLILLACLHFTIFNPTSTFFGSRGEHQAVRVPINAEETLARCRDLSRTPGPSPSFYSRAASDRYVPGTKPTLLKNAKIWTGGLDGTEVIEGDIFVDKGIIKSIAPGLGGKTFSQEMRELVKNGGVEIVDVDGAWITPGCVFSSNYYLFIATTPCNCTVSSTRIPTSATTPPLRSPVHPTATLMRVSPSPGYAPLTPSIPTTTPTRSLSQVVSPQHSSFPEARTQLEDRRLRLS